MNAAPPRAEASTLDDEPRRTGGSGVELTARARTRGRAVLRWLRRTWSDLLFFGLALGLVVWISWEAWGVRLITYYPTTDYWEHSATLRALMDDPVHPSNPHLPNTVPSPRFNPVYLAVAVIGRALGLDALQAMSVMSTLNIALFAAGIFLFFRTYFKDRRASLYGLIVVFCSWWEGFHFANVYQLKVLFSVSAYPSTTALGLSLLAFWFTLRLLRASRVGTVALAGLCVWTAAILVTHQVTAMMALSGLGLLALFEPVVPWRRRLDVLAMILLGCVVAELWPYFSVWEVLTGGQGASQGWAQDLISEDGQVATTTKLHPFYRPTAMRDALGLAMLGLLPLPYFLWRRKHLFIVGGIAAMGLPFWANAYVPLPLGHRFLLLLVMFLQISLVWLLLKFTPGAPEASRRLQKPLLGWFAAAGIAAILLAALQVNLGKAERRFAAAVARSRDRESPLVRYGRSVGRLAGPNAIVLADSQSSWPLPTFGPKVVVLEHDNPLVHDVTQRAAVVRRFFHPRTSDSARAAILRDFGITHVVTSSRRGRQVEPFLRARATQEALPAGFRLFTLRNPERS